MAKCYKPHTGADYYTILLHLFWAACVSYLSKATNLKILVTGASGFIGSRLVRRLLASSSANNYQITCMTRNEESLKDRYLIHSMAIIDLFTNEKIQDAKDDEDDYVEVDFESL